MTAVAAATSCSWPIPTCATSRRSARGPASRRAPAVRAAARASTAPTARTSSSPCRPGRRFSTPKATSSPTWPGRTRGSCWRAAAQAAEGTSASRRRPGRRRASPRSGLPGETGEYELRLKLLVDAALVGFPNAGKSSLLRRISNAKPKVADYPFTTISPVLGTVDSSEGRQLTVADVPGLIEGASEGVGLGHEFLAHLERARLLVHVIDAAEGDAEERFRAIDHELAEYGAGLVERPQIVALNKVDAAPDANVRARRPAGAPRRADVGRHGRRDRRPQARAVRALPGGRAAPRRRGRARRVPRLPARSRRAGASASSVPTAATASPAGLLAEEELEEALRAAGAKPGDEVEVAGETLELQ